MSQFRVIRVSLALLLVCAFPLIASAATTDFRILFDVDHDIATGCTVSTMPGVDQVFTTRVDTTASTAGVTQTFRQVCTGNSLGSPILIENLGWPAGFQSSSGQLLVETRIPFSSFPETTTLRNMRIGLVASQGAIVHTAIVRPNGDPVYYPLLPVARRRAVAAPGAPRLITLDGIGTDWNGLKAMFDGIGASGVPGLRIEKFFGFTDTNLNIIYFRFDANLSTSAPFAANDFYTRAIGEGLTVPGVNGDPTVLENDTDPNGLPLTATLVSQPGDGQVVLGSTGGFTYTPNDPNAEGEDTFEYRASNGAQDSNVATVTIAAQDVEVSGPNQEPSFDKGSDPLVLEDSGPQVLANWATNVTAGADEDDDQTVTFVITNVTNPEFFDDPPTIAANGTLTFTPAANAYGISTVTVKIIDDGGNEDGGDNESPTQNFFITIDPVNDVPSFTPGAAVVVEDNDGAQSLPWATGMSPGPANESTQLLDFILGNSNPSLFSVQPSIAPNGTLTFTPAPGQTGFANITVQIHDDGGTANGGVDTSAGVLLVLTVEKAPLITSANNTTFTVGQAGSFTVTTSGIPRPSIARTGTLPAGVTFVDGTGANKGTGVLSGTPGPGTGGTYPLTFTATNVRGSSPVQNFTLTVNQAPAITSGNTATFTRNSAGSFTITTTGFPAPALALTGAALPAGLTFTDNGNGTATIGGTPTATGGSFSGFTVTASNGVGANANQALTIVVNDVPVITSANATTFVIGQAGTFTVTATGFPIPAIARGGVALPAGVTYVDNGNGTGTLSGTPAVGTAGTYAIDFTASNTAGSDGPDAFTLTIHQIPAVTSANATAFTVGAAGTFTVTTTGFPTASIARGGDALPAGVTFVDNGNGTGTLAGTPAIGTGGIYNLTFTATNVAGSSAVQSFTLTVNEVPAVTSANNTTFTVGAAGTFTVTTNGFPAASIARGGDALPAGVTFIDNGNGTGTLAGTPNAGTGGVYNLTFTATNVAGSSAVQSFTLTVNEVPAVTSANNTTFTVGAAGTFTVTTNGFPAASIARGGVALPAGVTFVDNGNGTGTLAGTPALGTGGIYNITFTATNVAGSSAAQTFTFTVNELPAITSGNATTYTVGNAGTFTVTSNGFPAASIAIGGDALPSGVTFVDNGNGTGTLAGTPGVGTGGTYNLTFTPTNAAGSGAAQAFTLTIHQIPAVTSGNSTTFTVGAAGTFTVTTTGVPTPSIAIGGDALPSGVTFVDNGNGTGTLAGTPGVGTGGIYNLTFTATNAAGSSAAQSFTLTVNELPAITSGNATTYTVGNAGTFTVTSNGFPAASIAIGGDALPSGITFVDNGNGTGTLAGTPGVGTGGTYNLTFTPTNAAGSGAAQAFTLTIQQIPAVTSANSTTFTVGAAGTFTVTTTGVPTPTIAIGGDALPSGVTFVDNGNGTGTLAGTPAIGTGGIYNITFTATNVAGSSAAQSFTFTVNELPAITSGNATTYTVGNAGTFTVTSNGFPAASIAIGGDALPSGITFVDNGNGTGTLAGTPGAGTGGTYNLTFTPTNAAGTGGAQAFTLTIQQIPAVTSGNSTTFTVGAAGTFTVTTTGVPTPSIAIGGDALPSGVTFVDNGNGTGTLAGTPGVGTGGIYNITFTATNVAGSSAAQSFTLTVNELPAITSGNATTYTVGNAGTFTVTSNGFPAASIAIGGDALPSGITFVDNGNGTGTLAGTPGAGTGGTYNLTFTPTNAAGSGAAQAFTLTIQQIPAVTSANNTTFTVGAAGTFTVTTTGVPTPSIAIGGDALPSGVTFVDNGNGTGTLAGTPALGTGGIYNITFTATNVAGSSAAQSFTLTVNELPAITSGNATTYTVGNAGTFTVTTNGFPAASIAIGGDALPSGITFVDNGNGTGTLAGTPGVGTGGTYNLTFTPTNAAGSGAAQAFTLTIQQIPAVTSANSTTFTVGAAGTFTVTTTGVPTPTIAIGGDALPSGVTFVDNGNGTGTLAGTPALGTGGIYNITFTATNVAGSSAAQSFTLTVNELPAITSANNTTYTVGNAGTFTVTSNGFPAASIAIGGDALPSGITFVDNGNGTGTLAGTPGVGTGGTYNLTFTPTNAAGSGGAQAFTLTIQQIPAVTSANNTTFTVGAAGTFTVTTTGVPTPSIAIGGDALPSGVTFVDNGNGTGTLAGTPALGTGGIYNITFTATNVAGSSAVQSFTLTVNELPAITSANNTTYTVGNAGTFTVTSNGFPAASIVIGGDALPSGITFVDNGNGTGTLAGTPGAGTGGTYNLTFTPTNAAGTGAAQAFTLTIQQTPAVTSANSTTFTVGAAGTFTVTTTGVPTPTIAIGGDALPSGVTFVDNGNGTGTLAGTPGAGTGGIYNLTFTATNVAGSSAPQSFTLTVLQAPVITSGNSKTFSIGTPDSFTVTTTGFPAPSIAIGGATLPTGITFTDNGNGTGTLGGTAAPGTGGVYNVTFTATNPAGSNGPQAFTITVELAPTITSANSTTFQTGQAGTFTVTTTGFPTPAIAIGGDALPTGVTFIDNGNGTGTLAGTPANNTGGIYNLTFTATNSAGSDGPDLFTLTVQESPEFTSANNTTFTVGTAGTFTVTTQGFPLSMITDGGALPAGVTFIDNGNGTGTLAGTPEPGTNGTYNLTFTATNTVPPDAMQAFTLTVACPPITVAPAAGALPEGTFGVAYSQNFIASGIAGPYTYSVSAGALPGGLTLSPAGQLTGSPTTGNFSFTIRGTHDTTLCFGETAYTLVIRPNAQNDNYGTANVDEAVGNTQVVVGGHSAPTTPFVAFAGSIIANDQPAGVTVTAGTFATTLGGSITISADGKFTYTPPVGNTNDDTFIYTIVSNGVTDSATITIKFANKVWYVNNSVVDGGTGLSNLPFDTLVEAQAASGTGDIIYVDFGDGTTNKQNAGITLQANQQLIGEGFALTVNSHTLAIAGSKPLVSAAAASVVVAANGNMVKGLTLTGGTNGISAGAVANFTGDVLTIQNNTTAGLSLAGTTGTVTVTNAIITNNAIGLSVNAGAATINLDNTNTITANAAQRSVAVSNRASVGAGDINLGTTINDTGTGLLFNTNSVGTVALTGSQTLSTGGNQAVTLSGGSGTFAVNFSGTLAITTTTGTGFGATGAGSTTVTGTASIATGAAAAGLSVNGVTVGAAGMTFNSINTTGATTGVSLTSLGNGNVTINGGTLGAGTGLSLNTLGTSNVTLNNVTVTATATGISGTTFGTLTIAGTVPVSGPTALSLTTGTVSGTFSNVTSTGGTNGVTLTGVAGTWGATAGALSGASGVTFNVSGGSGNITWGGTIAQANGNRAVSVAGANTATINFNGNVTSSATSTGVILTASSGTYNFNGAANAFTGASGILISNGQSGTIAFSNGTTIGNVTNTPFQVDGSALAVTAAITYGGTIAKTSAGALIDVNNLDTPGTLSMTHTPAAAGNLSISNNGSTGISVINSSSTNITIANASVTFNNAGPGFTSTANTGGTINLQGIALAGSGNRAGMLLAGAGTINVTSGVAAPSINMTGGTNNAIDGTTTAFTGTLNLNNTAITGGGATAVRLGGGTLSGTGSTIAAGAQAALNLSSVALTNGAGLTSITSTGSANGVILANVTGGTYTIAGGSLNGNTTAAWTHTNGPANAATISFAGSITPAINARAIDIGAAGASTGLRGGTITFSGAITTTSNAANANAGGIRVRNSTGGTLTLSNATQSFTSNANIAVELATNPGTTFNFSGGSLTISSTTGKGFVGSGGGTINVTGTNNTISTTGNNAFEVVGSAGVHFGGGYEWRSITSTNGTKGISLQYHDGAFTVTGDGADGGTAPDSVTSGGTITGSDQRGAEFIDVDGPVSLNGMTFTNPADTAGPDATVAAGTCGSLASGGSNTGCYAGVHFDTVGSASLNTVNVAGSGQMGINGHAVSGLTLTTVNVTNPGTSAQEDGIRMYNLSGSGSMTGVVVNTPFAMGLNIENTSVVLGSIGSPFLISSSSFQNSQAAQGAVVHTDNTGVAHVKFVGGTISGHFSAGIQTANDGGTLGIYIDGTAFSNNAAAALVQGLSGTTNVDIRNITHVGRIGGVTHALVVNGHGNGIVTAEIINNQIGNGTVGSGANCGGGCRGISVDARITSSVLANIRGNTVRNVDESGIHLRGGEGSSRLTANITGNLIKDPDGGATLAGIFADSGVLSSDTNCVTAQIGGTTPYPGAPSSTAAEIQNRIEGGWLTSGVRVRKLFGGGAPPEPVFNLPLYDGSGVVNWIQTRNSFSGVATPVTQNAGGGGAFTGGTGCP